MTTGEIIDKLRSTMKKSPLAGTNWDAVTETSSIEALGFDSLSILDLVYDIQQEFGTFDKYIWQFTGGITICNALSSLREMPVSSPESDAMSKDLRSRGFKFVGTTICYAFMQAAGMVNDHLVNCWRFQVCNTR